MIKLLKDKVFRDIFKFHPLKKSFSYAFQGIWYMFLYHRNMRLIFLCGLAAFLFGVWLNLSRLELIMLTLNIVIVFIAEMFNTAIELIINMFTDKYHILIKIIKDICAGVVLLACLNALFIGYLLFFKKITYLLR